MRVYTVHLRRHGLDPDRDVAVVPEGFSWGAFLFGFLWALWHRMWWTALGLFVISAAAELVAELLLADPLAQGAVGLGVALAIGYVAQDLRRRHLTARGFAEAGVVTGRDGEEALFRYLEGDPALARDLALA